MTQNTESRNHNGVGETHFAVNKKTNLIIFGWDYKGYDAEELKAFKDDYFYRDIIEMFYGEDADDKKQLSKAHKEYKILTRNAAIKQGCDPSFDKNWSNDGINSIIK